MTGTVFASLTAPNALKCTHVSFLVAQYTLKDGTQSGHADVLPCLQDEKEALKIVHYLWDNAELAYVTISNRPLDAAKANRAVNVYRSEPSQQDLEMLASSFLSFNMDAHINTQQAQCIKACCTAYAQLTTNQELNFGRRSGSSRDLHHFFKYLARRHRCSSLQAYLVKPIANGVHTSIAWLEYLLFCSGCTVCFRMSCEGGTTCEPCFNCSTTKSRC